MSTPPAPGGLAGSAPVWPRYGRERLRPPSARRFARPRSLPSPSTSASTSRSPPAPTPGPAAPPSAARAAPRGPRDPGSRAASGRRRRRRPSLDSAAGGRGPRRDQPPRTGGLGRCRAAGGGPPVAGEHPGRCVCGRCVCRRGLGSPARRARKRAAATAVDALDGVLPCLWSSASVASSRRRPASQASRRSSAPAYALRVFGLTEAPDEPADGRRRTLVRGRGGMGIRRTRLPAAATRHSSPTRSPIFFSRHATQ